MKAVAIIPARYGSTRFPAKPLACETGRYLVQHVYERALQARTLAAVVVATDDQRIVSAVESFGGRAVMTSPNHPSGTDRVAEAASGLDCDVVINVQGDEPEMEPAFIDRVVELLRDEADVGIATLACPFAVLSGADPRHPHSVKVVLNARRRAIYFSRAAIPYPRWAETKGTAYQPAPYLLHLGIYGYRRDLLPRLAALAPTPLEQTESLEQLRWLENGHDIAVGIVDKASSGIDTPEDYAAFVARWRCNADRTPPVAVGPHSGR